METEYAIEKKIFKVYFVKHLFSRKAIHKMNLYFKNPISDSYWYTIVLSWEIEKWKMQKYFLKYFYKTLIFTTFEISGKYRTHGNNVKMLKQI